MQVCRLMLPLLPAQLPLDCMKLQCPAPSHLPPPPHLPPPQSPRFQVSNQPCPVHLQRRENGLLTASPNPMPEGSTRRQLLKRSAATFRPCVQMGIWLVPPSGMPLWTARTYTPQRGHTLPSMTNSWGHKSLSAKMRSFLTAGSRWFLGMGCEFFSCALLFQFIQLTHLKRPHPHSRLQGAGLCCPSRLAKGGCLPNVG